MTAAFGFAADPRALEDLHRAPRPIRDLALLHLQDLVHGEQRGPRLGIRSGIDLTGCRKLYVDPAAEWRIVYQERDAPAGPGPQREIFLVTIRPREDHEAYNTAARRLGRLIGPGPAEQSSAAHIHYQRAHAAPPPPPSPLDRTSAVRSSP
ncbi:hypothetical protein [Streptomyces carpaticus]|uniref:hypothetical protein n=1 Tax=Streptomyces carpaticus TaxID=285558 RepID=UPI0031F7B1C0